MNTVTHVNKVSFVGGSSSATSVTSNSTAETKPSSAVLNPMSTQYSPAESPDSTKRRSCVSLGNNSSNSKSSSNLTGSTKSDRCKINQNPPPVITTNHQGSSRVRKFRLQFNSFSNSPCNMRSLITFTVRLPGCAVVHSAASAVLAWREVSSSKQITLAFEERTAESNLRVTAAFTLER